MRKFVKGSALLLLAAMLATGCSLTGAQEPADQQAGQPSGNNNEAVQPGGGTTEENISPVPGEVEQKVKENVTLYYSDKDLMEMFRVEREIEVDHKDELPQAALELWMKGPEEEALTNLVPPDVVIEKIEFKDKIAHVSFSSEIKNANLGSGGEMFLIEQITLIMKQFGYDSTQILVEGKAEESILGHVTTNEPIPAGDPEQYKWFKK